MMTADAVGGVWTYAIELAAGLAQARVRVALVALGPGPSPSQRREAEAIPGLDLIETGLPLDWTAESLPEIERAAKTVRELARRLDVDLVHLNSPTLALGGAYPTPVLGVCHSCVATWWSAVGNDPMPDDFRWRSHALWRGMLACDALAAPSRAFAAATSAAHETPLPFVVHNGRDPAAHSAGARERVAFTAGRLWDVGKNLAVIDAAAALSRIPVYAAGSLTDPTSRSQAVLKHARPLGPLSQNEMAGWLRRAAIYVSSAKYEPFGLGVLEAAQAGCALVLSDIPTFRELWDGAAVFLAPDDADGFAAALDALASNSDRARRLGARARARARRYSRAAMTAGVIDLYRIVQLDARARRGAAA
jgi:glycosyltransferase involved in cell wall biosynthesis